MVGAQMCQWCGLVDPDSPLGRHEAKRARRRDWWVALAIGAVLLVAAAVLLTMTINNSNDKADTMVECIESGRSDC